jgi:hypothetical protein
LDTHENFEPIPSGSNRDQIVGVQFRLRHWAFGFLQPFPTKSPTFWLVPPMSSRLVSVHSCALSTRSMAVSILAQRRIRLVGTQLWPPDLRAWVMRVLRKPLPQAPRSTVWRLLRHETLLRRFFGEAFSPVIGHTTTNSYLLSMVLTKPSKQQLEEHRLYSIRSVLMQLPALSLIILSVVARNEAFLPPDFSDHQLPSRRGGGVSRTSEFLDRVSYWCLCIITEWSDCRI